MNIKRAANHDIRMNDEASARGQPQAPPFTFPLPLFSYWFSGLPPLLPIRGMCQQATIKRLMAISLYAPISVIQCQALPRLGDGGQATCLLWLHASWHAALCAGELGLLGHVTRSRVLNSATNKMLQVFSSAHLQLWKSKTSLSGGWRWLQILYKYIIEMI